MLPPSTRPTTPTVSPLKFISLAKPKNRPPDLSRLPKSVLPKRYELKLDVDLKEQNYSGKVNIRIVVQNDNFNNTIWLHSKDLNITSASILFSQFSMPEEAIGVFEVPEKGMLKMIVKCSSPILFWLLFFLSSFIQSKDVFYIRVLLFWLVFYKSALWIWHLFFKKIKNGTS